MTTYTTRWIRAWTFASTLGVALSLLVWSPVEVLGLFLTAAVSAALLVVMLTPAASSGPASASSCWERVGRRSVGLGLAVVAFGALVATMHYLVVPVLLLVSVTSPWVVGRVLDSHPGVSAPRHESLEESLESLADSPEVSPVVSRPATGLSSPALPPVPDLATDDLHRLSDQALCRRWRDSFAALQQARSPVERSRLVDLRARCLDELDRRSPTALAAWLASGAGPSGSPERFLTEERGGRPDAA